MLTSFIIALLGLILIIFNHYQRKRWLKFLLIIWGLAFILFANRLLMPETRSVWALATYFLLLAVVFVLAWLSLHSWCQQLAQRHPKWIRGTWRSDKPL